MKNSLKILIIILMLLICTILSYKYTYGSVHQEKKVNWQTKEPQLFKNIGYSKLLESTPLIIAKKNLSESQFKLEGVITNPFGIRDDILEFIVANIPSNNQSAVRAAILSAQINQQIYYGDITQDAAIRLSGRDLLVGTCLDKYMGGFRYAYKITRGIDTRMRDTKARDKYMWDIDRKYFSWKIIGSGLSVADENAACAKGEF